MSIASITELRPGRTAVASAVPIVAFDAPATGAEVMPIDGLRRRDALAVATWIVEHLPAKASPLRLATLTEVEKNWLALEALGPDHRAVDWVTVIDAVRSLAAVPTAAGAYDPSA